MTSFRALIDNSSDAISVVSVAGEVIYASASSAKIFGNPPEELLGLNIFDLIHPDDRDDLFRALREVLTKPPGPCQLEARIRQKNGQWCWVESRISNHLNEPDIAAIVVNCREIGARRAAREQSQRWSEELARANAELQDFICGLAHDFRMPLSTISMSAELLVNEALLDAHGKALAQYIIDGVTRMSGLFEGLHALTLSGFHDLPRPLHLGHLVAGVLQDLGQAIAASGAIVTVDPLPWVLGNEKHLLRVFQNLIDNAIKYRSEAPAEIHVTAESLGADWIIKVKDNGIGIAPQHHEHVFRLLKRLHGPETPGAGFGLAICKKIIEELGGAIWVESEPGAGSAFCFTIKAATSEDAVSTLRGDDRYPNRTVTKGVERAATLAVMPRSAIKRVGNGD